VVFVVLIQILHFGLLTQHQHQVHSDDKQCTQPLPCHTLQYFINNSDTYFVSNTTLFFVEGEYHLNSTDLIIKNVVNFSLIGTANVNTYNASSKSVIKCLQKHQIYFYSVVGLFLKHLQLNTCGDLISPTLSAYSVKNAAVLLHYCSSTHIINVYITDPVANGILAVNVEGINILENITIAMNNNRPQDASLRYGMRWSYVGPNRKHYKETIVSISNVALKPENRTELDMMYMNMLEFQINDFNVSITIQNSKFSTLHGVNNIIIIEVKISDSSQNSTTNFYIQNCHFNSNLVKHHIHVFYHLTYCKPYTRISVTVAKTKFSSTIDFVHQSTILIIQDLLTICPGRVQVNFNNVVFYSNHVPLLQVLSTSSDNLPQNVMISTTGYFIAKTNTLPTKNSLILLQNVKINFNGVTTFRKNVVNNELLSLSSSVLSISNDTVFDSNICDRILSLNCVACYIILLSGANLTFTYNEMYNGLTDLPIKGSIPYPYCLFQYFLPDRNQYTDNIFKVSFLFDSIAAVKNF